MRKRVALIVVLGAMFTLLAPMGVAQAAAAGAVCDDLYLPDRAERQVRACVLLNTNDFGLIGDVEGMVRFRRYVGRSLDYQVDWLHLYRNGNLVYANGPTGWFHITADPGTNDWSSYSTPFANNDCNSFRAVARFRIRTHTGVVGGYRSWDSNHVQFSC